MRRFFLALFLVICTLPPAMLKAQWMPEVLRTSPELNPNDSNKLILGVDMTGFFKNNEYFSPIAKGATFPGIRFSPSLKYQLNDKLSAEVGLTGLYYSGDQQKDGMEYFRWVHARMQYAPTPNLNIVLGNLYGGVSHRVIEPLYRWELQMTNKPESGIQIIYEDKRFFADTWVNWRRYIERGDTIPEVLTFGISSSIKLSKPENRLQLSVPLQLLIYHEGGQIDRSESPMIVAGNIATGINSELKLDGKFIQSVGLNKFTIKF